MSTAGRLEFVTLQEGSEPGAVLMLLHGVGANEESVAGLAQGADARLTVISLRAPLTMGPRSFAWFPVQFTTAGPVIDAARAEQSRRELLEFIREYRAQHEAEEVYLMGFSQGGIMSVVAALSEPELVQGAVGLSGRLPAEFLPQIASTERLQATRLWVGHGVADEKLPVGLARELRERVEALGVRLEYVEHAAGHVVPPEVLAGAQRWLRQGLDEAAAARA